MKNKLDTRSRLALSNGKNTHISKGSLIDDRL